MYSKVVFTLLLTILFTLNIQGQDLTKQQKEDLKYKVHMFTHNDEELQRLWYEDRMDKMKLRGELREDYQKIVVYHAYKMERLDDQDSDLSVNEIKNKLQKQLDLLNADVKDILDPEQFEIHKKSWKAILKAVYQKKKWTEEN